MPRRLLCGNGSPWGVVGGPTPWTPLWVWLARLGVGLGHCRAYHPQTQGKVERFHRSLRAEALTSVALGVADLRDLAHAQAVFDAWLHVYNHERPHEALGLAVPASRYQPSPRPFPEALPPVEYDASLQVRRVQQHGEISWRGRCYQLSNAFVGQLVGLRSTEPEGGFAVYYLDHCLASLDTRSGSVYPVVNASRLSRMSPNDCKGSLRPLHPLRRRDGAAFCVEGKRQRLTTIWHDARRPRDTHQPPASAPYVSQIVGG